jgi:crossover junction endodeoxyribonuclease RuvC
METPETVQPNVTTMPWLKCRHTITDTRKDGTKICLFCHAVLDDETANEETTMQVLGLDLSLNHLGWALVDEEGQYTHGLIKSKSKGVERLRHLRDSVDVILTGHQVRHAVVEGYSFSSIRGHDMGEVGGIIRLLLFERDVTFREVPPATLKKWTSDKGNAQKDFMLLRIYKRWGVEFESIDEAEAFAAAKWGLEQFAIGQ